MRAAVDRRTTANAARGPLVRRRRAKRIL